MIGVPNLDSELNKAHHTRSRLCFYRAYRPVLLKNEGKRILQNLSGYLDQEN